LWFDGVELAECQTDEAVGRGIANEAVRDSVGQANSLGIDCGAANVDRVDTDRAGSEGAVAIADIECASRQ
jgi:hypothetical protein